MTSNAANANRAAESVRKQAAARDMEDIQGLPRERIAQLLGVTRSTVGKWLGPPKRPAPPVKGAPAMHSKTEPVGNLPTWPQPTVGDYERDETPAAAPDGTWFNNRLMAGHDRDAIEEGYAQARAREAAVVRMGG